MPWNDDYELIRRLGRGGYAEVWLARRRVGGMQVALKMPRDDRAADIDARAQALLEVEAMSNLNHPGIVQLHHVYTDSFVLALEYMSGGSLAERIARKPLSTAEAIRVGIEAGEALAFAHQQGRLHRDIKPHNLLLAAGKDGKLKIGDFGLAVLRPQGPLLDLPAQAEEELAGTMWYIAPEQIRGARAGPETDLWALCVTLFNATTGEVPFPGLVWDDVSQRILKQEPDWEAARRAGLEPALQAVLARGLEKDPERRYRHLTELLRELERLRGDSHPPAVPIAIDPSVLGREQELGDLEHRYEQLSGPGARGVAVFLHGEPGIGKSTLAEELLRQIRARWRDPWALASFREAPGFRPLAAALGRLLETSPGGEARALIARSFARAGRAGPTPFPEFLADTLAWLQLRGRFLLVLEDIQDADIDALELLRTLVRAIDTTRGLVLLTGRRGERPEPPERADRLHEFLLWLRGAPACTPLELGPLALEPLTRLLSRALPDGGRLAPEVAAQLHSPYQGNPQLAAQALAHLLAKGTVAPDGTAAGPLVEDEIAPGIRVLVERSLLSASALQRRMLQVAAVEGNRFRSSTIAAVLGLEREPVLTELEPLVRRLGIVTPIGLEYRFANPALREVLLQEPLPERRLLYHRQIAEHLAALPGVEPEEVARHFDQAGAPAQALPHYLLAARRAGAHSASRQARELYTIAHRLLTELKPRSKACAAATLALARLERLAGHSHRAQELLEALGADAAAPPRVRAKALHEMGWLLVRTGDTVNAQPRFVAARKLFLKAGDLVWAAACRDAIGQALLEEGRMVEALRAARRALAERRKLRYAWGVAISQVNVGVLLRALGRPAEALASYEAALDFFREFRKRRNLLDVRRKEALALSNIAAIAAEQGDARRALGAAWEALAQRTAIGDRRGEAVSTIGLADAQLAAGLPVTALDTLERAARLAQELDSRRLLAHALLGRGRALLQKGRHEEAAVALEDALREARAGKEREVECRSHLVLCELALTRLDAGAAHRHLDLAATVMNEARLPLFTARLASLRGRLAALEGQSRAALRWLRGALERLAREPSPELELQTIEALAARLARSRSGQAEARRLATRATVLRAELAARRPGRRLREAGPGESNRDTA